MLLLRLRAKESGEKGKGLCADIVEGVEGEGLEDLEDGEEVFLEPVFEVPDEEMCVRDVRMKQRLVTEVSVRTQGGQGDLDEQTERMRRNVRT